MQTTYLCNKRLCKICNHWRESLILGVFIIIICRLWQSGGIRLWVGSASELKFTKIIYLPSETSSWPELKIYDTVLYPNQYSVADLSGFLEISGKVEVVSDDLFLPKKDPIVQSIIEIDGDDCSVECGVAYYLGNLRNLQTLVKSRFYVFLRRIFNEESAVLVTSMLLGKEMGVESKELKDILRLSGLSHILSVSGMHMNLLFLFLCTYFLCFINKTNKTIKHLLIYFRRFFGLEGKTAFKCHSGGNFISKFWSALFLILILIWYVLFVGASPSALRAVMVLVFGLINGHFLRLSRNRLSFLVLSFLLLLSWNPYFLSNISFLLSYSICFGFVFYDLLVHKYFSKYRKNLLNFLQLFVPLVFSAVLTITYFGELNLIGVLSNWLLLWLVPSIFFVGIILFLLFTILTKFELGVVRFFVDLLLMVVGKLVSLFVLLAGWLAKIPFGFIAFEKQIEWIWLFLFCVCVFVGFLKLLKPAFIGYKGEYNVL